MITSEEIKRRLWNGANELRGSMDASRYKDYMLGLMFYKFLSDKTLNSLRQLGQYHHLNEAELLNEYHAVYESYGEQITKTIQQSLGYCIAPEYLYQSWLLDIKSGHFEVQKVTDSFNQFELTISQTPNANDFKGLFANSTLDLNDTALGGNLNERSKNIKALIQLFSDLNMIDLQDGDVLGDAYEYLIGMFAMESGKKAGEFYTPHQVSEVMAQIVAKSNDIKSIYDPAVGSGSLLLTVGRHLDKESRENLNYYGQEKNTATYNLTRMNLLLHDVKAQRMTIRNGDTLAEDWPEDPSRPNEGVLFDAVVMNPPYSLKHWNRSDIKVSDPRFEAVGVLPPDSKGDYAFLLHGLFHLAPSGTMAIVLPHGVLFRGGTEGIIRQRILERNIFDTIIGLPANMFTNTGIPVVVVILKKNRPLSEPLLFIDASKNFTKVGKQNALRKKDIAKIVDTYVDRAEKEGYSHLASRDELIENDYNLNIPRYVNSAEKEIPHDVDAHIYGGIPLQDVKDLEVLNLVVADTLKASFREIRPGYFELTTPMEDLRNAVLSHPSVTTKAKELEQQITEYIDRYWQRLREVSDQSESTELMEEMLDTVKELLRQYRFINVYDGYQIIADAWDNSIAHDLEIIAAEGFYVAGRKREPNMVMKGSGSNRRQERDGWIGSIVPNGLVEAMYYQDEIGKIEDKESRIEEINLEYDSLVEAAKEEGSDEFDALNEVLKKNSDDEPLDAFDMTKVRAELKLVDKGSLESNLLTQVNNLNFEKADLNKEVKADKKEIDQLVQDKIPQLTNDEIDFLIYKKWFGEVINEIVKLVNNPIKTELSILENLNDRYKETISAIDDQICELEKKIIELMGDMVVTRD